METPTQTTPETIEDQSTPQAVESPHADPTATPLVPFGVACRHCAFDLKQQPVTGNCPECSAKIQDSLPGYTPEWTIADSRPCLNCEYDLVGQHLTSVCPECGAMLSQSINGNLLRYSGYGFVNTLQTGVKSISWSINTMVFIYAYMLVAILVSMISPALGALAALVGILVVIGGIILSVYFAIAGWWKLSEPDPRNLTRDSGENIRAAIRTSLIVYLAMIPVAFLVAIAEALGAIPAPLGSALAMIVSMLAFTVLLIGTMKYIQRIAYRVPSVKLRKRARTAEQLMMMVIYGYAVMLLAVGAMFLLPQGALGAIGAVAGIAGVLVGLGSLFSLVYFTRSLSLAGKVLAPVLESTDEPNQMHLAGGFGLPSVPDAA